MLKLCSIIPKEGFDFLENILNACDDASSFAAGTLFGAVFSGAVFWAGNRATRKLQNKTIENERKRYNSLLEQNQKLNERINKLHSQGNTEKGRS